MPDITMPQFLSMIAGAGAAYIAVRVGLANVTTLLGVVVGRLDKMEQTSTERHEKHAGEISALREKDAAQQAQINGLRSDVDRLMSKSSGSNYKAQT
jgi:hypothetical protein